MKKNRKTFNEVYEDMSSEAEYKEYFEKQSKIKYTPGPWRLRTKGTFDTQGVIADVKLPCEKKMSAMTVAEVDYRAYRLGIGATIQDHHLRSNSVAMLHDMEKANAKLIAAAPDMLVCLTNCLQVKTHKESIEAMKQMIRGVIEKATV